MRRVAAVVILALLAGACSRAEPAGSAPSPGSRVAAQVASADLYTGTPQRVLVGMIADDGRIVTFGAVRLAFAFSAEKGAEPEPGPQTQARYIPTPGTPAGGDAVSLSDPSEARGVYQADAVVFDRPGIWTVTVETEVAGLGAQRAEASFVVNDIPQLPAPGDRALRTENLTLDSKGVPKGAIDSLAVAGGPIPDPGLHEWTIASALREGRPAAVAFATPAFCVSRFCGPVVSALADLSERYRDRAVFIHVEIWHDYENREVNEAAADWLQLPTGDMTEPWLYLIGSDGRIIDRWGALYDPSEVAAELELLPPMS